MEQYEQINDQIDSENSIFKHQAFKIKRQILERGESYVIFRIPGFIATLSNVEDLLPFFDDSISAGFQPTKQIMERLENDVQGFHNRQAAVLIWAQLKARDVDM